MARNNRMVTIQDVAKAAGVSVSTVSRVLNDKDDVAPDTYQRVKNVIEDLGYTSSLAARSMRSRSNNLIGLIVPDVYQSFPIMVMRGVNRAVASLDYDLLVYTSGDFRKHYSADRERHYVKLLNASITDGVIVVASSATNFSTAAPVVAVDPHYDCPEYPSVISHNYDGVRQAMSYLFELGHRRIGFISGRQFLQSAVRRQEAFADSMREAGIPIDQELITQGDFTTETAIDCTKYLLKLDNPPSAIFAANDQSALGVYEAARQLGVSIPGDLSVIGFDNIPETVLIEPRMTTVDQSIEEMGFKATQILLDMINGKLLEEEVFKVPAHLVVRDSCKAIA